MPRCLSGQKLACEELLGPAVDPLGWFKQGVAFLQVQTRTQASGLEFVSSFLSVHFALCVPRGKLLKSSPEVEEGQQCV